MKRKEETLEDYENPRLKPATNKRNVIPSCCGTCAHHLIISGFFLCKREDGWEGDAGEGEQWFRVCDGHMVSPSLLQSYPSSRRKKGK